MSRFQRRQVLIAACALLAAPFALGQPAGRRVRIAILDEGQEESQAELWRAFRDQLQKLGYVEGITLVIEARFAQGVSARMQAQAAELVALKPDMIVTTGTPATQAAIKATSSIPIVFTGVGDPVKSGLIASLARPGGNVTGQFRYAARGLTCVTPAKRPKSLSPEATLAPCSSASAARCASEVRFPAAPLAVSTLRRIGQCISPGPISLTKGWSNQASMYPRARGTLSGLRMMRGCVVIRTNASATIQGMPTDSDPDSACSSQRRATAWCGESRSTA